jgi:hypothetical protein
MTEKGDNALSPNPPSAYRPTTAGVAPNPDAVCIALDSEPFTRFDQFSNRNVSRSSLHPTWP